MSDLLELVIKELKEKMANDIEVIDLKGISPFTDYFVITSANNQRLAKAMVNSTVEKALQNNFDLRAIEGEDSEWILVDLYDVIIHVFVEEARYIYQLEKLWGDLPRVNIDDL
ncbi:MAG: ribosome silencing factor [Erysipelotrichaceae bacterium]|nr:ribosome silencing factor [Erysipelotrichaceae bacterium]